MADLSNKRVAILSETGFEESELMEPKAALEKAGARVDILSPQHKIKSWKNGNWGGVELVSDIQVADARPGDYDALLLPGGVLNPDKLRQDRDAVEFTTRFMESGKPVAAICHGAQTLIETGLVKGRRMTSYPGIQRDLSNAGANWVDEEVVEDEALITSRRPGDIPAFNARLLKRLSEA